MKCTECNYKEAINSTTIKCVITKEERAINSECNCDSARSCRDNKAKVSDALTIAEDTRNALRDKSSVVIIPKDTLVDIYNTLRDIALEVESNQLIEIVESIKAMF